MQQKKDKNDQQLHQSNQPNTNLEYFIFESYAGFFIPPGKLIDRESIIIFIKLSPTFAGVPYTQFEKMFMIFDRALIALTLGGGLIIIQIVNFCSNKIRDLVFGEGVR
jgi:hypothetical protein